MDNSDGSTGLCLVWPMGKDAQGQPQQAALGLGSLTDVSHFTIEFADGQRVALSRWMGDSLQASMITTGTTPGEWLVGAAGGDRINVYGEGSQVMGGRGDDTIELNADASVLHFDRGDDNDVLSGLSSGHHISFGAGIAPEDLSLTVTPEGKAVISIAGSAGTVGADSIELPMSLAGLADSDFIAGIAFADGTVWTMEHVASLVPPTPDPVVIETGAATTVHVGPEQIAVAAVPGVAPLSPWSDPWRDLLAFGENGVNSPLSSGASSAPAFSPQEAALMAQVDSLIQAMAAFAPPSAASFAPSMGSQVGAVAPVLAVDLA